MSEICKFLFNAKVIFFLLIGTGAQFVTVQAQDFPRDTSYTTQSAFQKYVKDYPNISIVETDTSGLRVYREVVYKHTGKRNLHMDIFKPKRKRGQSYPLVLMVHGGGWISGDKSLLHPLAAEIARAGYVTASIEYRLSPEARYPAALYDIKTGIRWLKDHARQYDADSSKVVVLGTSAGGQLAALAGTTAGKPGFSDPADTSSASVDTEAIIDIDGVLAFIHPVSEEGRVASLWLGGDQQLARDTWIEASALTHTDEHTPPVLFIGGENPRFLAGKKEMQEILFEHLIPAESHRIDGAPHSFWLFDPWFQSTVVYTVNFLKQVLKQ